MPKRRIYGIDYLPESEIADYIIKNPQLSFKTIASRFGVSVSKVSEKARQGREDEERKALDVRLREKFATLEKATGHKGLFKSSADKMKSIRPQSLQDAARLWLRRLDAGSPDRAGHSLANPEHLEYWKEYPSGYSPELEALGFRRNHITMAIDIDEPDPYFDPRRKEARKSGEHYPGRIYDNEPWPDYVPSEPNDQQETWSGMEVSTPRWDIKNNRWINDLPMPARFKKGEFKGMKGRSVYKGKLMSNTAVARAKAVEHRRAPEKEGWRTGKSVYKGKLMSNEAVVEAQNMAPELYWDKENHRWV